MNLGLVIFDVDGTLVDSQAHIVASMEGAFAAHGMQVPDRSAILSIVGLSLPQAFAQLVPGQADRAHSLAEAYKDTFASLRMSGDAAARSPLFPGAAETLRGLAAEPDMLLGIATGKSKRGLDHLIDLHGWQGLFQTVQVADFHPSKPHPAMVEACLSETGVAPERAVMVGDTKYDMEMARAAGVAAAGVAWGYHSVEALAAVPADAILRRFEDLPEILAQRWAIT